MVSFIYIMLDYSILFRSNEKDVSAPFRLINLLFTSVIYTLILLILLLLMGLNVTLCGTLYGKRVTGSKYTS